MRRVLLALVLLVGGGAAACLGAVPKSLDDLETLDPGGSPDVPVEVVDSTARDELPAELPPDDAVATDVEEAEPGDDLVAVDLAEMEAASEESVALDVEASEEVVVEVEVPDLESETVVAEVADSAGLDADACTPRCDGVECGDDGCGGTCGTCVGGKVCQTGACVCAQEAYRACCGSAVCGFDSCGVQGQKVGDCPKGCQGATCLDCTADCAGKECGEDGCGHECGQCKVGACDGVTWTTPPTCVGDHCQGGGGTQSCDDANACTRDTCDPKLGCGHRVLDDGTECQFGSCGGLEWTKPKTCASGQCAAGGGTTHCDDGNLCTDDACVAETGCVSTPHTRPCDDGDPCTTGDSCTGGQCVATGTDGCDDHNVCTTDSCVPKVGCKHDPLEDGTDCLAGTCNGKTWTKPGTCLSGVCKPSGIQNCDDGLACTDDACAPTGCTNTVKAGTCRIAGACLGDNQPFGKCRECRSSATSGSWTYVAGKACDDGDACTRDDNCVPGGFDDSGCQGTAYSCDDSLACTGDECDGKGGCANTLLAGYCKIAGKCYSESQANPENPCQECSAATSPTDWTNLIDGAACGMGSCGGLTFTSAKTCLAGQCTGGGGTKNCDDANACTTDTCTSSGCGNALQGGWCLIAGMGCVANGQANVGNGCQVCTSAMNTIGWTPLAEGASCGTGGNVCRQGVCNCTPDCTGRQCGDDGCGGSCGACDDGLACTTEACQANGTCSYALVSGYCKVGGRCFGEGQPNPDNVCQQCSTLGNDGAWSSVSDDTVCAAATCNGFTFSLAKNCVSGQCAGGGAATNCDDGNACTTDACTASGCSNVLQAGYCLIPGTGCVASGVAKAGDPCHVCTPGNTTTGWSAATDGTLCLDGSCSSLTWTRPKTCSVGQCAGGGGSQNCDDGKGCTTDACASTTGCSSTLQAGNCLIGGVCYANLAVKGGNSCLLCVASTSTTWWTCASPACQASGFCY